MKNITKNEIKVYLLGLVATVMTINSVATLSKNSYKLFLDKERVEQVKALVSGLNLNFLEVLDLKRK